MSTRMLQVLTDDYDDVELKPGQGQTVTFSLQGQAYEIDLSDKNLKKLQGELAGWIDKARPASTARSGSRARAVRGAGRPAERRGGAGSRGAAGRGAASRSAAAGESQAIREWARSNGHQVSERGRISSEIRAAYAQAH